MLDVLQSDFVGTVLSISESNMSVIVKLMHPEWSTHRIHVWYVSLHVPQKINQTKCIGKFYNRPMDGMV